jgi:serine/threonine-protein kinase
VLGELLGRGGMAEVFAGHVLGSHGFQKPVAIKRLLPELANDHVFVERLISEAKLLVGMTHGNIVSVLDLARDGDNVFLVMEYVDGPSLRQLLKARGTRKLSLGTATYIVQAAAAGLEFAHARPGGAIIHADISPSNLLLTTSGEVRVADFGIARREGGSAGVVEGKWAYMAPEQARGEPLSPRSDVFALGVVLYELITGQHPFGQRVTPDERDSGPIRIAPPRVVNPQVPPGLDAICMKALSENARERYGRMQHLIDALVDERFNQQYREGANDLAQAIREIAPGSGLANSGPRTQHTDRPVTIMTRSLITPHRASSPRVVVDESMETFERSESTGQLTSLIEPPPNLAVQNGRGSVPVLPESGARTAIVEMPQAPQSGGRTAIVEMPQGLPPMPNLPRPVAPDANPVRIEGTPANPYRALAAAMLPSPELTSVHGGGAAATITGSSAILDLRDARASKWTFAVLGVAALMGVIAAIATQLREPDEGGRPEPRPEVATATVQSPDEEEPEAVEQAQEPTVPAESAPAESAPAESAPTETVRMQATPAAPAPAPAPAPNDPPIAPPTQPVAPPQPSIAGQEPPPAVTPDKDKDKDKDTTKRDTPRKPVRSAQAKKKPAQADSMLRVNTYDAAWASVHVNGETKHIPEAKFKLPAGTYNVRLRNPQIASRSCRVSIASGKTVTLTVDLVEGTCDVE